MESVLHIDGNDYEVFDYGVAAEGVPVITFNYRGIGASTGPDACDHGAQ